MNNGKFYNSTNPYHDFPNLFKEITHKCAPIKQKKVRGNNSPFMTKELRKAIMDRSRLPNKYLKYPSKENFVSMKKMKNICNSICKKSKTKYLKRITEKGISSNKQFRNFVKAFLTNKGCMSNDFISIRNGDTFIDKESKLVEMFNSHYINIVEKTSGVPPENYVIDTNNTQEIIEGIIRKKERHPSILKIKNNFVSSINFDFPKAEVADINALLKQTDPKKATGPDTIPPKLVKMSANITDNHLCDIMNMGIENYNFPDNTKVATVRPIYNKKSRNVIENYRSVSLLNAFSKVYEEYIHNSITPFVNNFLSIFISAYRKSYS